MELPNWAERLGRVRFTKLLRDGVNNSAVIVIKEHTKNFISGNREVHREAWEVFPESGKKCVGKIAVPQPMTQRHLQEG